MTRRTTMGSILLREASRWGLRVELRGDMLALMPKGRCPAELAELLRSHKREIINLLEARGDGLKDDEAPWLHIGKQILAGEFDGADSSMRESLTIGLRSIRHP